MPLTPIHVSTNLSRYILLLLICSHFHQVLSDRTESDIEEFFRAVENRNNDMVKMELAKHNNFLKGRSSRSSGPQPIPSVDIFSGQVGRPLACGGSYEVTRGMVWYWSMNSNKLCYHAFLGSRSDNCRVALLCNDPVRFRIKKSDGGCDKEFIKIYDATLGFMTGCGWFNFKSRPRYARNNGTDLYIYYKENYLFHFAQQKA